MEDEKYIVIGEQAIAIRDIKDCYISDKDKYGEIHMKFLPIGEYRRKIWFSDYIRRETLQPNWKEIMDDIDAVIDDTDAVDDCRENTVYRHLDDSKIWSKYIDMKALDDEYQRVKKITIQNSEKKKQENKENNAFTGFFKNIFISGKIDKIDKKLATEEVIFSFNGKENSKELAFLMTNGRLYYDGKMLRCSGSPFDGRRRIKQSDCDGCEIMKVERCSQDRLYEEESVLLNNGELKKILFYGKDVTKKVECVQYLHLITDEGNHFAFSEDECNIHDECEKVKRHLKQRSSVNPGEKAVEYAIKWVAASNKQLVSISHDCESKYRQNCILLCKEDFIDEPQEYDHIIVSCAGIILIETKNWRGSVEIREDGTWVRSSAQGIFEGVENPRFQMRRHEILMQKILPDVPVYSFLCFSNPNIIIEGRENFKNYPIVRIDELEDKISDLCLTEHYSDKQISQMAAAIEARKVGRK